jgi:hypothetical protein
MQFAQNNFFTALRGVITGGGKNDAGDPYNDAGFWRDVPVPLSGLDLNTTRVVDTSDAGAATDPVIESGAYLAADETNARVVKVDDATDSICHLTIPIPRDYDEKTDDFKIRVLASQLSQSTDDDVELDAEAYVKVAGESLGSDLDPTAPGTVLSTTEQWIEVDLAGNGLTRDSVLTLELITNGANDTNGEEVLIHAFEYSYRSVLTSYDEEDASGNDLR